jgi:transcription antitermination factor NusG
MKKSILVMLILSVMIGCKSKSVTDTRVDNRSERVIKGDWVITSVTFPGSDYMKLTSFDIADSKCFVASKWNFVSNNNKGNMALTNAKCSTFSSDITWFLNKEGQFVMKVLNAEKAKKVYSGYILTIANLNDTSFQLVDKVNIGGKLVDVVYQFDKSN